MSRVCGGTLLSGELLVACVSFYNSQGHLSRGGTTPVSCALPHQSSISQGSRAPQALSPTGQSGWDVFSGEVPSSSNDPGLCQIDVKLDSTWI